MSNLSAFYSKPRTEPYEVLLRQFNRVVQQSGILTEARKRRNFTKDPSRPLRRNSAIRKQSLRRSRRGY